MKKLIDKIIKRIDGIRKIKLWNFIVAYILTQVISDVMFICFHPFYGGCIISFILTICVFVCRYIYLKKKDVVTATRSNLTVAILGSLVASLVLLPIVL